MLAAKRAFVGEEGDTAPPPPWAPDPLAPADDAPPEAAGPMGRGGMPMSLQIVNPDALADRQGNGIAKRRLINGQALPSTPWDGQLEALVR